MSNRTPMGTAKPMPTLAARLSPTSGSGLLIIAVDCVVSEVDNVVDEVFEVSVLLLWGADDVDSELDVVEAAGLAVAVFSL
jgi:hypothetical protein